MELRHLILGVIVLAAILQLGCAQQQTCEGEWVIYSTGVAYCSLHTHPAASAYVIPLFFTFFVVLAAGLFYVSASEKR